MVTSTVDNKPEMTSVKEAAARLGVSRFLVDRAIQDGEIPAVRLGKRVLIPRWAVEAMVNGEQPNAAVHAGR